MSGKRLLVSLRSWAILGLSVASLLPGLAAAHSEGTEASDPSSPAAVLGFGVATRQYVALDTGLRPWRTAMPVRAPMNHADHAARAVSAGPMDHSQHSGTAAPAGQADHSQHAQPVELNPHAGHAMPVEVEVRKPAADAHQGH